MSSSGEVYYIKKPRFNRGNVDIDENSWNRIIEYVFKWCPVLTKNNNQGFIQR